ncbi:glycoside hydrolase family 130 protein [soil metagenome]
MLDLFTHELRLHADPSRVVVRPFHIAWAANGTTPSRTERLVREVLAMSTADARAQLEMVLRDFEARHWQTRRVFMTRYDEIEKQLQLDGGEIGDEKRQLIGAYFCHEYSYAAAALMNPSAVPHFDQSGMPEGSLRILMSLRAVGEGHISSVAFREGIITDHNQLTLAPEPPFATATDAVGDEDELPRGEVTVYRHRDSTLSGTVIFPITQAQSKGLEDLRLVHFTHDDGSVEWLGTYTAYNGSMIQSELMRTTDFRAFDLVPMTGPAARNKGMALFPRKVCGKYMMIGRQDGENLFLLTSDTLTHWDEGELLLTPHYPWELVQIGNCGPPIEVDEGWLLLTHGVGAMRKYSIGAVLLDKDDPSKVIGRTPEPILAAADQDREGYVPNVVYTCGAIKHGDVLFIPYGIADSSVGFAFATVSTILDAMDRSVTDWVTR